MDGLELAVRFSYITNQLRFCGPKDAEAAFLSYLGSHGHESAAQVEEKLRRFEALYPYLSAIAAKAGKAFTDPDVVEAYWLGNRLLEGFTVEDMRAIIRQLQQRGLPERLATRLIGNLPDGFVPHHDFNVFYVGVGNTTKAVPTTLQTMDHCRISAGKVISVQEAQLLVKRRQLIREDNLFSLGEEEVRTAVFLPAMMPHVKAGDTVAMHWGFAPLVLSEGQLSNLKKYTQKIFSVMNTLADRA
ncbi:MAG: DUF6390 family protein [Nanoarchaeota archaeon]